MEIDGIPHPKDSVNFNYATSNYLDHYRGLKLIFRFCAKEPLLKLFITYTDKKIFYPIQIIHLRFIVDHIILEKLQLFEEYRGSFDKAHFEARLFTIINGRGEIKMVSDGD